MIEKVNPSHPDKLADRIAGAIVDLAYAKEQDPEIAEDMELVTLRVEPSEPCWHCKGANRQDPDNVWRDKFCRKCGRSLE